MPPNCWLIKVDSECSVCGRRQVKLNGEFAIDPGDLLIFYYRDWNDHAIACCVAYAIDVNYKSNWGTETIITLNRHTSVKVDLLNILPKTFRFDQSGVTPLGVYCNQVKGNLGIWV